MPHFEAVCASKLVAVSSDLTQLGLGLSNVVRADLVQKIDVVLHCAANVDFAASLDDSFEMNVRGSLRLLAFAAECKSLSAFVHVSTAFVASHLPSGSRIAEELVPLGFDAAEMLARIDAMPLEQKQNRRTVKQLVGNWPNVYCFSKAVAEHLMVANRGHVPLIIVRPSIVGAAAEEPVCVH